MDTGLAGKRALVAAASQGLGLAVAKALAAEGCRVSICSRDEGRISRAAQEIVSTTGTEVHHSVCDLRDPEAAGRWVGEAVSLWGGLDAVVANSGGPPPGTFGDLREEQWDEAYRLTLLSAVRLAREARPYLGPGSSVLFMTSLSVKEPIGTLVLSNVFRAGVASLAKSLSREWARDGIRVNQLLPGRIATPRIAELEEDQARRTGVSRDEIQAQQAARIPLGRYGQPGEFAAAATFLLSEAASYITGASLQVDGGALHYVL
jgi:3-oxoacyl-[acyl-carrier protein] reductase